MCVFRADAGICVGGRGLLDERACEAQHLPLELSIRVKWSALCKELNGDSEDVRIRKCDCRIR
eukprot:15793750-Heterocapsa_arctica.AAC.1